MNQALWTSLLLLMPMLATGADVKDMSGTWVLNADRSTWGKKARPLSADVTIEHAEPKYKYSGSVHRKADEEADRFRFDGAIDGKNYPIQEDRTKRTMSVARKGPDLIESTVRSADGKLEETSLQSISSDGKTLIRKMVAVAPDGKKLRWTEIYEKKN